MSKYIIKNCPSCTKQDECIAMFLRTSVDCKYRNDCVLKQIVEKCGQKFYDNVFDKGKLVMANEILQLLDIQEVE